MDHFSSLDSTRLDSTLTYQSASSPLRPPSCTFETSIFRSRRPLLFHPLSLSLPLPPFVLSLLASPRDPRLPPLSRMHRAPVHFAILNAACSQREEAGSQPLSRVRDDPLALMEDSPRRFPRITVSSTAAVQGGEREPSFLAEMIYHCRQLRWINDATALPRD